MNPKISKAGLAFSEITLDGIKAITANDHGRHLIGLRAACRLMQYKAAGPVNAVRLLCSTAGVDLDAYVVRLKPTLGLYNMLDFIGAEGIQALCGIFNPSRTVLIRQWLGECLSLPPESFIPKEKMATVFTTKVGKHNVRVACAHRTLWILKNDVATLLEYPQPLTGRLYRWFSTNGIDIRDYLVGLRCGEKNPPHFINVAGASLLVKFIQGTRTKVLSDWLNKYGTWSGDVEELIQRVGGTDVREVHMVAVRGAKASQPKVVQTTLAMAAEVSPVPDTAGTFDDAYCRGLFDVLASKATPDELVKLEQYLEGLKDTIVSTRFAPELNDAAYRLRARFKTPVLPGLSVEVR